MKIIPIQYIGPSERYEDSNCGSGWWSTGEVRQVPWELAEQLVRYNDTWQDARPAKAKRKDPLVPAPKVPAYIRRPLDETPPAIRVDNLSREALERYALMNFNERFAPDITLPQMQRRVVQLMGAF